MFIDEARNSLHLSLRKFFISVFVSPLFQTYVFITCHNMEFKTSLTKRKDQTRSQKSDSVLQTSYHQFATCCLHVSCLLSRSSFPLRCPNCSVRTVGTARTFPDTYGVRPLNILFYIIFFFCLWTWRRLKKTWGGYSIHGYGIFLKANIWFLHFRVVLRFRHPSERTFNDRVKFEVVGRELF